MEPLFDVVAAYGGAAATRRLSAPLADAIAISNQGAAMPKGCAGTERHTCSLAPLERWEDEKSPDTDDLVQIIGCGGGI